MGMWILIGGVAVVAILFGIQFARKNPKKADTLAAGMTAAGQKIEDGAKAVVTKVQS